MSAKTLKYVAVQNGILDMIENGVLKPGDQLQPELELARTFEVSLGTAQKALRILADRGVLVRRQGHGTFVSGAPTPRTGPQIRNFRFLADDGSLLPIYTHVISIKRRKDRSKWKSIFPKEKSVVCVTRIINVNLEFRFFCELLLPTSRFRAFLDLDRQDLDGVGITHYIEVRCGVPILKYVHRLQSIELLPDICSQINVPVGTNGTEWQMYGYSYNATLTTYQRAFVPPHSRRLEFRDPQLK